MAGITQAEGTDRTSLLLPGNQDALVRTVSSAAAKRGVPVVLLTMNGGPIDLSMARDSNSVGARPSLLRLFPPCALSPHAQGSGGATATVPFAWRGHTKSTTTRAGRALDLALRLE